MCNPDEITPNLRILTNHLQDRLNIKPGQLLNYPLYTRPLLSNSCRTIVHDEGIDFEFAADDVETSLKKTYTATSRWFSTYTPQNSDSRTRWHKPPQNPNPPLGPTSCNMNRSGGFDCGQFQPESHLYISARRAYLKINNRKRYIDTRFLASKLERKMPYNYHSNDPEY